MDEGEVMSVKGVKGLTFKNKYFNQTFYFFIFLFFSTKTLFFVPKPFTPFTPFKKIDLEISP